MNTVLKADAMVKIVDGILHCLNNPDEYLPSGALQPDNLSPHLSVGGIFLMRPNGVMGTIPSGYETNALDVIGDSGMNKLVWF